MFVTASNKLKLHHWPDEDLEEEENLNIYSDVIDLSWSKNNNYLLLLKKDGIADILNVKDLNNIRKIHTITVLENITAIVFARCTKKCVAIGTSLATVALYSTQSKSIENLFHMPSSVVALDFNSQDNYLAVACNNRTISIINVMNGKETFGTEEGSVFVFEVEQPNPLFTNKAHINKINGLVFTRKNNLITIGSDNFCIHDYEKKKVVFKREMECHLTCIDIAPDGKYFAIGTNIGKVFIFESENCLNPIYTLNAYNSSISCLKYSKGIDENRDLDPNVGTSSQYNENEVESLYNKYANVEETNEYIKLFKAEYASSLRKYVRKRQVQMNAQMENLQEYAAKEFENINFQLNGKLDILNLVLDKFY